MVAEERRLHEQTNRRIRLRAEHDGGRAAVLLSRPKVERDARIVGQKLDNGIDRRLTSVNNETHRKAPGYFLGWQQVIGF
jgi:hypothetical protein